MSRAFYDFLFRFNGADDAELAVGDVLDVVFKVGHFGTGYGVAVQAHRQEGQVVAHSSAGLIVASHLEDLSEHEDVVPGPGHERVALVAAVRAIMVERASFQFLHQFSEGTAFVVAALGIGLEFGAVERDVARDLDFFLYLLHSRWY